MRLRFLAHVRFRAGHARVAQKSTSQLLGVPQGPLEVGSLGNPATFCSHEVRFQEVRKRAPMTAMGAKQPDGSEWPKAGRLLSG